MLRCFRQKEVGQIEVVKLKWLRDTNRSNVDNLNSVTWEASKHFRHKEEYPKAKIDELETNNEIKNIRNLSRSISDFKKD